LAKRTMGDGINGRDISEEKFLALGPIPPQSPKERDSGERTTGGLFAPRPRLVIPVHRCLTSMACNEFGAILPTEMEHDDQLLVAVTANMVIEPVC
jgi:hypothetical protein